MGCCFRRWCWYSIWKNLKPGYDTVVGVFFMFVKQRYRPRNIFRWTIVTPLWCRTLKIYYCALLTFACSFGGPDSLPANYQFIRLVLLAYFCGQCFDESRWYVPAISLWIGVSDLALSWYWHSVSAAPVQPFVRVFNKRWWQWLVPSVLVGLMAIPFGMGISPVCWAIWYRNFILFCTDGVMLWSLMVDSTYSFRRALENLCA